MAWDIRKLLSNLVRDRQSERTARQVESDGGLSTKLYSCPDCEATYISDEMESCPGCNESVEQIPSERDLGF